MSFIAETEMWFYVGFSAIAAEKTGEQRGCFIKYANLVSLAH